MKTDNCALCGQSRAAHSGLNHNFTLTGELTERTEERPKQVIAPDIILRLVLIDKGVISAEDITLKEVELRDKLRGNAADSPESRDAGEDG